MDNKEDTSWGEKKPHETFLYTSIHVGVSVTSKGIWIETYSVSGDQELKGLMNCWYVGIYNAGIYDI